MIFIFSVFGLGTLIFTGLEIAMHATMEKNCVENILIAHPILQALFTFLQMHFLFVNSQVRSHLKHRKISVFFRLLNQSIWVIFYRESTLFWKAKNSLKFLWFSGHRWTIWLDCQIRIYAFSGDQYLLMDSNNYLGIC